MDRPAPQEPALRPLSASASPPPAAWLAVAIAPLASLAGLLALLTRTDMTWVRALLLVACAVLLVVAGTMIGLAAQGMRHAAGPGSASLHPTEDDPDEG